MTYAATPRFEITRVLARMSGVIGRNLPVFAGLALALSGAPNLVAAIFERGLFVSGGMDAIAPFGMGWLVSLLISVLLQAALIHATISDLSGRRVLLGDCLTTAIRNVLPLIGIGIATTVATVVGLFFFVVPGIILALALCVSAPAQVVEGHGVFEALARSADLTRNHRWAILLLFVLFGIGLAILQGVAGAFPLAAAIASPVLADDVRRFVVAPLMQAFSALVGAAGIASIYFELRTIKEGVGVEALAKAFE